MKGIVTADEAVTQLPRRAGLAGPTRRNDSRGVAMPGLSGRFNTLVKAKVSSVLDRAEDPAETLDYSYEKQLELLQQAKSGIVDVVTAKKRLQQQEGTLHEQVAKLDGQARQALAAGNEDLSRQALMRKQAIQDELGSLDQQLADLEQQQQQLIESENKLKAKVEAFRTQKEVVKAQYSAADAQVQISSAATGVGEQMADVGLAVQRAMDKTENMKARADAVGELEQAGTFDDPMELGGGSGGDDVDRQLEQLTSGSAVDSELEKLKAELAGAPAPQLPSGDGKESAA
jgi:phage shock protein A